MRTLFALVAATRSSTPVVVASAGTERDNNRVGQRLVHQVMEILLTNLGNTSSVGDMLSTVDPVEAVLIWKPVVLNVPSLLMLKVTGVDERME